MKPYGKRRFLKNFVIVMSVFAVVGLIALTLEVRGGYITTWYQQLKDLIGTIVPPVSSLA